MYCAHTALIGSNFVPTIVLNTGDDQLLGFLLIAGHDPISSGTNKRDCVFTGVPRDPALLELPASQILQTHKNQEFELTLEFDQSVIGLSVLLSDMLSFCARIAETKSGSWYFVEGDSPTDVGRCKVL